MSTKAEIEALINADFANFIITALSAVVASGGTGYTVGDDITLVGGTGTAAVFNVDAVTGGVVDTVSLISAGAYTIAPTNPVSTTGGTGTGATLTVTFLTPAKITAAETRNVLKDDIDGLMNTMYATELFDSDVTQTFFTLQDAGSAAFTMNIIKQGRQIHVSCTFFAILAITRFGSFVSGDLTILAGATYYSTGLNISKNQVEGVEVRDVSGVTSIFFTNSIAAGTKMNFSITYNTDA